MENDNKRVLQYGYQPGSENRGYQPSASTQNNTQNSNSTTTNNSQPPKGGNVAQKD